MDFLLQKGDGVLGIAELFIMAVVLSMDAFAVAVCKGLSMKKISLGKMAIVGGWFGLFQALMPAIGYLLGSAFAGVVNSVAHWIAFSLLLIIGINMIREAVCPCGDEDTDASLSFKNMLVLAIATSIDALAVGVSFAMIDVNILAAVSFIGVVTFCLSAVGVKVGSVFGTRYNKKAQITGGIVLVCLGLKIVLEHYGMWF